MIPRRTCGILFLLGLLLFSGCSAEPESLNLDHLLVLEGAILIDGTGSQPRQNAAVVIQDDKILRVGNVGDYRYREDATILDLRGSYILPGFMELHAHVRENMMPILLAFGITTIRNPSTNTRGSLGVDLRDKVAMGEVVGPRMFTAGDAIDTPESMLFGQELALETADEIRAEVRRQAATEVDYIKLYQGISPPLLSAAVEEAHAQGIKVLGHLKRTSWIEAASRGIDGLAHSGSEGPIGELLDPRERNRFQTTNFGDYMRSWSQTADLVDLEGPRMTALVKALVESEVEINPTLVALEALYWADDSGTLERQQPAFAPEGFAENWSENWKASNQFMQGWNFTDKEWLQLKEAFRATMEMVRVFHERGVLITAGSDVGGWLTPGVSFHRELELLVQSGISPIDVLQIATRNGAQALGILHEVGTVEPGKLADLVILEGDPLEDIRNTLKITDVFRAGRRFEPESLLQEH